MDAPQSVVTTRSGWGEFDPRKAPSVVMPDVTHRYRGCPLTLKHPTSPSGFSEREIRHRMEIVKRQVKRVKTAVRDNRVKGEADMVLAIIKPHRRTTGPPPVVTRISGLLSVHPVRVLGTL